MARIQGIWGGASSHFSPGSPWDLRKTDETRKVAISAAALPLEDARRKL